MYSSVAVMKTTNRRVPKFNDGSDGTFLFGNKWFLGSTPRPAVPSYGYFSVEAAGKILLLYFNLHSRFNNSGHHERR